MSQSMEVGLEQERLQQEAELNQKDNEEEVQQHTNTEERCLSNYWDRKPSLIRDSKECFKFIQNNPQIRWNWERVGTTERLL